jgi:hypothetical protein
MAKQSRAVKSWAGQGSARHRNVRQGKEKQG